MEKRTLIWSVVSGTVSAKSANMQLAAETTYLEATRVPPQNCFPVALTRATIQGYLLG